VVAEPRRSAQPGRLLLAIPVAAGLILSAPFVGQVRGYIRQAFPGHFVLVVGGLIAAGLLAAIAAAVVRIRDHPGLRYGAIVAAILIAAVYATFRAGENPESNVVELFHFLQYGLVTFLFYRAWRGQSDLSILILPVLAGLIVGTLEEWLQWFIPNRVGEMNDVLLNLVAIGCGLLFSMALDPPDRRPAALGASSRRWVGSIACVALLVFAAFFHVVHLGYVVHDEEAGEFMSRYSRYALSDLQRRKSSEWQTNPPPVRLVRLSREDQYLTEGIQHVRWRNRLWASGDVRAAWLENRILERYFAPVLDTPTHEGAGHRWPAEQRADAAARSGGATNVAPYISAAYPYRLYAWPRSGFWLAVAIVTAAIAALTARTAD
jgi:VanZ family protein